MFGATTLVTFLLLWTKGFVGGVRLTELRVPMDIPEGDMAILSCNYDMGADTLYSVKWYKNGREFYRYVPKNEPPVYFFPTEGVHVDLASSSNTMVALLNLTQASAGVYKCEVSGEAPTFTTAFKERRINVHLLPKHGPHVTGLKKDYNLDEVVIANCSLPPSSKAVLKWLINDQPAPSEFIQGPWVKVSAARPDAVETILQIGFRTAPSDFVDGVMKLKCLATIPPLYQGQAESIHYIAAPLMEANVLTSASAVSYSSTTSDSTAVAEASTDYASSLESAVSAILIPIILVLLL